MKLHFQLFLFLPFVFSIAATDHAIAREYDAARGAVVVVVARVWLRC